MLLANVLTELQDVLQVAIGISLLKHAFPNGTTKLCRQALFPQQESAEGDPMEGDQQPESLNSQKDNSGNMGKHLKQIFGIKI